MASRSRKYNNKKATVDGISFHSKREALRYMALKLMELKGEIHDLTLQPSFLLQPGFYYMGKKERDIKYIADFSYMQDGKLVIEDVKGMRTEVYKLKRKLFLSIHAAPSRLVFIET